MKSDTCFTCILSAVYVEGIPVDASFDVFLLDF